MRYASFWHFFHENDVWLGAWSIANSPCKGYHGVDIAEATKGYSLGTSIISKPLKNFSERDMGGAGEDNFRTTVRSLRR